MIDRSPIRPHTGIMLFILSFSVILLLTIQAGCSRSPREKEKEKEKEKTGTRITTAHRILTANRTTAAAKTNGFTQMAEVTPPAATPADDIQTPVPEETAGLPQSSADLSSYGSILPHDPAYRLDVPCIRQVWEPWGMTAYAFTSSPIEMSGCALTSLAMVLRYYGLNTDPGELNTWLKNNNGYIGNGAIVWQAAVSQVQGLQYLGTVNYPDGADLSFIREMIDRGFPVLAEMHYRGTSHYVVLCGYRDTTFYANDPWYENPGHTLDRTVMQGSLPVAYDDAADAARAIHSIVIMVRAQSTAPRVRVLDVRSDLPVPPTGWLKPLVMREIVMTAGDRFMSVDGERREISVSPDVTDGRLRVPLQAFVGALGGTAALDPATQKMLAELQGRNLECWPGIRTAYHNTWYFDWEIPAGLTDGDLLVNAEVLSQQLGCLFAWDPLAGIGTFY